MKEPSISPVVKWVGGKRQLLSALLPYVKKQPYTRYIEPFIGGGALLLALLPEKAIINDYNKELINVYEVIQNDVSSLIACLMEHEKKHSKAYFYAIRSEDRKEDFKSTSPVDRAARFLYLNKTCYNGLFRVNAKGQFNVPFGQYKHPNIVNREGLIALAKYFTENQVHIYSKDYADILAMAHPGDFVYLDPPYMPLSESSSFTSYTDKGFSYKEQVRLRNECNKLRDKGISFIESNSDCKAIRELYKDYNIVTVKASRSINSKALKRGKINEVLITYGI